MQKTDRLLAIEKILAAEKISSHEELLWKLRAEGIACTQATLSRNLRQLGAVRRPDPGAVTDMFSRKAVMSARQLPDVFSCCP